MILFYLFLISKGLSGGQIFGIVIGSIVVALLAAGFVLLLIPKYQLRLWEYFGKYDAHQENRESRQFSRFDVPLGPMMNIDPQEIEQEVMGGTGAQGTQKDVPSVVDPTKPGSSDA